MVRTLRRYTLEIVYEPHPFSFQLLAVAFIAFPAFAGDHAGGAITDYLTYIAIGSGLAIGLAAAGGGIGQVRAAAAALGGIARNPGAAGKLNGPMILGLALIESLVIYAFVIAIMLVLKVPGIEEVAEVMKAAAGK